MYLSIYAEIIPYADDTTLIVRGKNVTDLEQKTMQNLRQLEQWLIQNKMLLNINKSKCMLFGGSSNERKLIDIKLHGDKVASVDDFKLLGITLDYKLCWKPHIDYVRSNLAKSLYSIRTLKNILPKSLLRQIYFALVHSHLQYGTVLWGNASSAALNPIIIQQKKAIRLINKAHYNAHTAGLFKQSNILTLENIFILQETKFVHSFYQNHIGNSIKQKLLTQVLSYLVRSTGKIRSNRLIKGNNFWLKLSETDKNLTWTRLSKLTKKKLTK